MTVPLFDGDADLEGVFLKELALLLPGSSLLEVNTTGIPLSVDAGAVSLNCSSVIAH